MELPLINKLLGRDSRSLKATKNILLSIGIKGVDTFVYLALVPITLGYLNQYEYGIWLTLNSILMWINSFDIGLGNGLRNKLAESEAKGNKILSRKYVSTTSYMLFFLMLVVFIIGGALIFYLDWYQILGTNIQRIPNLKNVVFLSFAIFCLNFFLKIIGNVYLALQLPAVNNLMVTSGHLLSLILIFLLTIFNEHGSLLIVAVVYSISPTIIYLIAYPITFKIVFRYLSPSFKYFDKRYLKSLLLVGVQFFCLQIAGIILFSFSNIFISHNFGPENVTPYNISYRYFSMITMLMGIISAPMWSASTDAYVRNDINWIKNSIVKIQRILLLMCCILFIMVLCSSFIYRIWVGSYTNIPFSLSILMSCYVAVLMWSTSYSNFLNGMGKLKLQTLNTVIEALLFYPVCWIFSVFFGLNGVVIGMILINSIGMVVNCIQFYKVLNGKAIGIWSK